MSRMNEIRQMVVDVLKNEPILRVKGAEVESEDGGVLLKLPYGDHFFTNEFIAENAATLVPMLERPIDDREVRTAILDLLSKSDFGSFVRHQIDLIETSSPKYHHRNRRWLILSVEESQRLERAYFGPDRKAAYTNLRTPGELHWAVLNFDWKNRDECLEDILQNPSLDFGTAQFLRFNTVRTWGSSMASSLRTRMEEGNISSQLFQFIPYWESDYEYTEERFRPNQRMFGQYDAVYRPRTSESPRDTIQAMRLCIREALAIHPVPALVNEDEKGLLFRPFWSHGRVPCESFEFRVEDEVLLDNRNKVVQIMEAQRDLTGPEEMLAAIDSFLTYPDHKAHEFLSLRDQCWNQLDNPPYGYELSPVEQVRLMRLECADDWLAAYRALRTKAELHEAIMNFNCDGGEEALRPIIRNPNLDRGSALAFFWNRYLFEYLPEPGEQERDLGRDTTSLAKELYRNLLIGYYTTEEFSFKMEGCLEGARPDIPDSLKQPIHGKYPGSPP